MNKKRLGVLYIVIIILIVFFTLIRSNIDKDAKLHDRNYLIDNKTGLIWEDFTEQSQKMTWNEAVNYCKNLKIETFGNWRTPTI